MLYSLAYSSLHILACDVKEKIKNKVGEREKGRNH